MAYTAVVTHATGDVFPASDWNTYVRDNIAHLHGDGGAVTKGPASFVFPGLVQTGTEFAVVTAAYSGNIFQTRYGTDTTGDRWRLDSNGVMNWGPGGTSAIDTNLYRGAAGQLRTDSLFWAAGGVVASVGAGTSAYRNFLLAGDSQPAFNVLGNGTLQWGAGGGAAVDTSFARSVAGIIAAGNKVVEGYGTTTGGAATWTPTLQTGVVQRYNMNGTGTLTISSAGVPAAGLATYLTIIVHNAAGATVTLAWNAIYVGGMPTSLTTGAPTSVNTFVYDPGEAKYYLISSLTTSP